MPKLVARKKFRLYGVSETPDKVGYFSLVPFDNDDFNQIVEEDEIVDTLARLVRAIYGRGGKRNCYEITENMRESETININIDGYNRLEIPNIIKKYRLQQHAQLFIVVSADCMKYQWVVTVFQYTVYSDEKEWDSPDEEITF